MISSGIRCTTLLILHAIFWRVYNINMKLVERLSADYPSFRFVSSATPHWNQAEHTIYYNADGATTLHELGHALLGHQSYGQDIELIQMERAAWNKALCLAPKYGVRISTEDVEAALDSYRDWLYKRSLCPTCGQCGVQSHVDHCYTCPNCHSRWRASSGKNKRLRRNIIAAQ